MRGIRLLNRWTKQMVSQSFSKAIILLYHRINSLPIDPQKLCVSKENFEKHLNIIHNHFHPISLQQLCCDIQSGNVTNRSIVITFDDGYADNLLNAKPILEKYDIPATVFTVSDWVDSSREFFWDDVFRILLTNLDIPNYLEIEINGKKLNWDLSDNRGVEFKINNSTLFAGWDVERTDDPSAKHRAYREIVQILRDLEPKERENLLKKLYLWAGISSNGRNDHRILTSDELLLLEKGDLIKIGGHTKSHSLLSKLTPDAQKDEIFEGKYKLEQLVNHSISSFSYPWGGLNDYNESSIKLVKEAGFDCSCSNFPGYVHRWSDPFQLPRFIVRNWEEKLFEKNINKFFSNVS